MSRNSATRGTLSLRRSNSLSLIPTLVRESRARAKSITRSDGRKTSLEQNLKRSSSSLNLLRTTPLQTKNIGSSLQGKGGTSGTKRHSALKSPYSIKKERPVNDKKWIGEQFLKVRRYLEEHPACDQNVVNNLKPPTLNTFVYVCNLLFKELDPRIEINLLNYKEILVAHLKVLNYPGTISNSLLKTVNTMHSWSQVISIFSWLIDLLSFISRNTMEPEVSDEKCRLKDTIQEYLSERYILFNKNEDQTPVDEKFVSEMNEILGNNEGEFNELSKEVEHFRNIQKEKDSHLSKVEEENKDLIDEIEKKKDEMNKFHNEDPIYAMQQEIEIQRSQERKQLIRDNIMKVKENINELKKTISKQPCTYAEKKSILLNIDEMKYTLELKKEKIEECLRLKSEFDYKLVEGKRKLEAEVYRLNKSVMQIAIMNPEMKSLNLREKGFHSKDFTNEIKEFVETKNKLESKFSEDIVDIQSDIDALDLEKKEVNSSLEVLVQQIGEFTHRVHELEEKSKVVDNSTGNLIVNAEENEKQYITALADLRNKEPDLQGLELQINAWSDKLAVSQTKFINLQSDSIRFFQSINKIVMCNLKKMDQIRVNVSEKIILAEKFIQGNYEDLMHCFTSLEENLK